MSKITKIIVGIVVIIAVIWIVAANVRTHSVSGDTIKIGVVAPLTGGGAIFGQSLVDAIKLAQEDLKNTKKTYQVIIEDDGTNPAQSASAGHKLVDIDKVSALISITSGTGNSIKPIAAAATIPHICICADITVSDNQYNFTDSLIPADEAGVYIAEAKKRGIKSVAIWSQIQSGIDALVGALKDQLPAAGITLAYNDRYDGSIRDFKTTIVKGQKTNPDSFFILAFPPSLDIIGQQFKDAGISKISAISAFGITVNPSIFEGYWYTDPNLTDPGFRDRFEKSFPGVRFNVRAAPYGYDAFMILTNAFESGQDAADYIKNLKTYAGKVGETTKTLDSGNFRSTAAIWTIKNGRSELLY